MPAENVRRFGGFFEYLKKNLLEFEVARSGCHPSRWEKKGASLFTARNVQSYPELRSVWGRRVRSLSSLGGEVIYYGQVKPLGSARATGESTGERNSHALRQVLARCGRLAARRDDQIMIVLDSVDDKPRREAVHAMSSFMYVRTSPDDVERIVEATMQVESHLYATIQFADWMRGLLGRASHHQYSSSDEHRRVATFRRAGQRWRRRTARVATPRRTRTPAASRSGVELAPVADRSSWRYLSSAA